MNNFKEIIITTNGPGEITSWVTPVLKQLSGADYKVTIMLMPCSFATGKEHHTAEKLEGVTRVIKSDKSLSIIFSRKKKLLKHFHAGRGVVLFLGGDPFWAYLLGERLGYKVFGYSEHKAFLFRLYHKVFYRSVDGDLMTDAFSDIVREPKAEIKTIAIFAGSRFSHFRLFIPFYENFIKAMTLKGYDFILGVSPYISDDQYKLVEKENDLSLYKKIYHDPKPVLQECDFLITMPGTNTAQAAIAKVPYCVLVPLNEISEIPLEGLGGILTGLPYVGAYVRKIIIWYMKKKIKFFALPNVKASKKIIPEICTNLTTENAVEFVENVIYEKLKMEKNVIDAYEVMAEKGIASEISAEIEAELK